MAAVPMLVGLACERKHKLALKVLRLLLTHQEAIAPIASFLAAALAQSQRDLEHIAIVAGLTCKRLKSESWSGLELEPLVPNLIKLLAFGAQRPQKTLRARCLAALEAICSQFTCDTNTAEHMLTCLAATLDSSWLLPFVLRALVSVAPALGTRLTPEIHAQAESMCLVLAHLRSGHDLEEMDCAALALVPLLMDGQRVLNEVIGLVEQGLETENVNKLEFLLDLVVYLDATLEDKQVTNVASRLLRIYLHPATWTVSHEIVLICITYIMGQLATRLKLSLAPFMESVFSVLLPALQNPEQAGLHLDFVAKLCESGLIGQHAAVIASQLIANAQTLDNEPATSMEDMQACLLDHVPAPIAFLITEMTRSLTESEKQYDRLLLCVTGLILHGDCNLDLISSVALLLDRFRAKAFADPECLSSVREAITVSYSGLLDAYASRGVAPPHDFVRTIWNFVKLLNEDAACLSENHLLSAVGLAGDLDKVSCLFQLRQAPVHVQLLVAAASASARDDLRSAARWAKNQLNLL
jgi:hypothetical protein